jgi:hypothetical protein
VSTDWALVLPVTSVSRGMSNDGFRCRDFQPREMIFGLFPKHFLRHKTACTGRPIKSWTWTSDASKRSSLLKSLGELFASYTLRESTRQQDTYQCS